MEGFRHLFRSLQLRVGVPVLHCASTNVWLLRRQLLVARQRGWVRHGNVSLDGLNVIMVVRCDGHMRENKWKCWFYMDDRATSEQFDALKQIFTAADGGHLGKIFGNLWEVQEVQRAKIEMKIEGWQHRASIIGKLGLAIGILKPDAGPTLCRLPNVPGLAANAEENWFNDGEMEFDHQNKNGLTTTFEYHSEQ